MTPCMPPPLTKFGYGGIINLIHPWYDQETEESMGKATTNMISQVDINIQTINNISNPTDIVASYHCYWQLRGMHR